MCEPNSALRLPACDLHCRYFCKEDLFNKEEENTG